MAENYMLFVHRNGITSSHPHEVGSRQRLQTYMKGMEQALILAGYTRQAGVGTNVRKMNHQNGTSFYIELLTETQWRQL